MAFHYISRTITGPVRSDGQLIKDGCNVVIADVRSTNPFVAAALADLINLGLAQAKLGEEAHAAQERKLAKALRPKAAIPSFYGGDSGRDPDADRDARLDDAKHFGG